MMSAMTPLIHMRRDWTTWEDPPGRTGQRGQRVRRTQQRSWWWPPRGARQPRGMPRGNPFGGGDEEEEHEESPTQHYLSSGNVESSDKFTGGAEGAEGGEAGLGAGEHGFWFGGEVGRGRTKPLLSPA